MPEVAGLEVGDESPIKVQLVLLEPCASDITPGGLLPTRSCLLQG
jgi:hypothetical protein